MLVYQRVWCISSSQCISPKKMVGFYQKNIHKKKSHSGVILASNKNISHNKSPWMLVASVYIYICIYNYIYSNSFIVYPLYCYTVGCQCWLYFPWRCHQAMARGSCWPEALGVLQMMEEDQVPSAGPIWWTCHTKTTVGNIHSSYLIRT